MSVATPLALFTTACQACSVILVGLETEPLRLNVAGQTEQQLLTNCSSVGLQTLLLLGQHVCVSCVGMLVNPQPALSHTDILTSTTKASCTPVRWFACMSNFDVSSSISTCRNLVAPGRPSPCGRPPGFLHLSYSTKVGNGACVLQVPCKCLLLVMQDAFQGAAT